MGIASNSHGTADYKAEARQIHADYRRAVKMEVSLAEEA